MYVALIGVYQVCQKSSNFTTPHLWRSNIVAVTKSFVERQQFASDSISLHLFIICEIFPKMDSKDFQKDLLPLDESKSEWFLVQYDQDAQKLTRKIVNSDDLMWNEELLKVESDNDGQKKKEHVLIRDQNKLHLGHIIYRAKTLEECIDHHTYLQIICMQLVCIE